MTSSPEDGAPSSEDATSEALELALLDLAALMHETRRTTQAQKRARPRA